MANRVTAIGGVSDWTSEVLTSTDLNDTITQGNLFNNLHFVAYDATVGSQIITGNSTLKQYSLSTSQSNYDYLMFIVRGNVQENRAKINISPPDTADKEILDSVSTGGGAMAGFCVFVAGTDYTKGDAEVFDIIGVSENNQDATYYESIVIGIKTS